VLAVELLKNRYQIMLTRAARGGFVFCEDEQTAVFLRQLAE